VLSAWVARIFMHLDMNVGDKMLARKFISIHNVQQTHRLLIHTDVDLRQLSI